MMIRTLAVSASILLLATGGAFAQAANADTTCAELNAMPEADRLAFAQEYIDSTKGEAGGNAALRSSDPSVGAAPDQAGEPGKASGGPENQAANAARDGQPLPAGGAADEDEQVAADANASSSNMDDNAAPGDVAANPPAGVDADDAVQSFKGIDAAGLVGACANEPDKTFVEVMPIIPAPAGQ